MRLLISDSGPMGSIDEGLRAILVCPDCRGPLEEREGHLRCAGCSADFPVEGGIADMLGSGHGVNQREVATQDHVSEFYELVRYQRPHARLYHEANVRRLCELVRLRGRVLDNGCGNGFFFDVCGGQSGLELYGLDISEGMLAKASRPGRRLVRGDSCRLPFGDAVFDTIFARSLLHHLPNPEAGVAEMLRVLRPGGDLIVLDTNKSVVSTLPRLIANRGEHFDEEHKNFEVEELTSMLGRHATVDHVEFIGYLAYPLMGFPDLFDFGRFLPLRALAQPLLRFDRLASKIPGVRRLGWGVAVKAHRAA